MAPGTEKQTDRKPDEMKALRETVESLETEILKLRRANAVLEESEEKYRTIFETTGTATIVIEDDTIISMVNSEFENLSGFTREEIEGKRVWTDFIQDMDIAMMKTYHHRRRETPETVPRNYECRLMNKWRDEKIAMMTVALIPGTRQSVASVRDITEKRQAEEALKYSEEKFSKAFRSSPQAMMISTLKEGRIVDVNDTLLDITGYDKETLTGMKPDEIRLYDGELLLKDLMADITRDGRIRNREVTFRGGGGEVRYGYMSAEVIDLQGTPCMLTSISDITEQRRLEAEILRISEAERRKIGYDLHDDLGQHLVGIEALSTLLTKRLEAEHHPEAHRAEEISTLIREATGKTRNLSKGLCPVDMDEGGLVSSLTEFSGHIKKVFGVECRLCCDIPLKIGNNEVATHLYRIVQEAVNNALRHGKADVIQISLTSVDEVVSLTVSDNGRGMRSTVREPGLGLSIMRYRAKSIRASIDIHSEAEKGTQVVCQINRKYLL